MTALVRSGPRGGDDADALQSRMAELEIALAGRRAEVTRMQSVLAAFKIRYRQEVGLLHEELDELERAIAEAELGEHAANVNHETADPAGSAGSQPEPALRFTSDAVRRLFRDVAKAVHPDLARDALTRDRRHSLMIAANQAYASGDEERLRSILQAWERSPDAVVGDDPDAARLRIVRRIEQIEEQLDACDADMATLTESPIWKLKVMVDEAAARGKNLVGDMVKRLKRDIMVARNRLEAIRGFPE